MQQSASPMSEADFWGAYVLFGTFTDLYELTMTQAYYAEKMFGAAVFELSFRSLPSNRQFVVASGFADVVDSLLAFRFSDDDLDYLRRRGDFAGAFLEYLAGMRFTGDAYAVPEGTIGFPHEPLLQVVAPIGEAQIIETLVVNQVHFQSIAVTKARRIVAAAGGRSVIDFGSRRAHGTDAALKIARATFLAGGAGTSNVLAAKMYDIPAFGTMAHSYIQAHDDEFASFLSFAERYPDTTLLVDTYDTLKGVRKVIELKRRLGDRFRVAAIRLDSGDLRALAIQAREMLDSAGLKGVNIFASSGLDEYEIDELLRAGAPIDAFGVGTNLAVLADAPSLDMAYKLVEYDGKGRLKLSAKKRLYPGRKQVFRQTKSGKMISDSIGRFDEVLPGQPLLEPLLLDGRAVTQVVLTESRARLQRAIKMLPEYLSELHPPASSYPVEFSKRLQEDLGKIMRRLSSADG